VSGERPRQSGRRGQLAAGIDAAQVKAYLRAHPEFLIEHPDAVEGLSPPGRSRGDNVHDLQQFMLRRLNDEVRRLKLQQRELIALSRANLSVQSQVHNAALAMLEARSFEHLIHIVTTDLAQVLDVDVVTICVETAADAMRGRVRTAGVHMLEPHGVDSRIGQGSEVLLANDVPADPVVFGPAAGLVKSQALARIRCSKRSPAGLLALGARDAQKFHPQQGTEMLQFLAGFVSRAIRGWLSLPG
jgi:hypothetical protein